VDSSFLTAPGGNDICLVQLNDEIVFSSAALGTIKLPVQGAEPTSRESPELNKIK
jgi:hypothetical protein